VSGQKPREIAIRVLERRGSGPFVEELLEHALSGARLTPPDRHLCQELVYGIVRHQATLDWLLKRKTDGRNQKPLLQNMLRLGLYQIFWLERIPGHAAVNETVELAKANGFGAQAGFINAILRGYLRELEPTRGLLKELKVKEPALGYSHPDWLAKRWLERWGAERTAQLMEWDNTPPATFARINTLKTDATKLLAQWRAEGVEYDFVRHDWVEENLVFQLKSHPPLGRLPSFLQGYFYVQDPSTLLAPRELAPKSGESILDLCAAPGGKLTCLAQLMGNKGFLAGHDLDAARLTLVEENCTRLGVTCAKTYTPETLGSAPCTAFDRILVDAPCSNTGVMRRRLDLRWRIRPEEVARLRTTQLELLRQAARLLKSGGTLVYSTCSLEPEENGEVVKAFLALHAGFALEQERALLPFADGTDGAFVARLVRKT
jgi:16S rRNA (cytosine967-C5)-methyltransferase